MATTGTGQSTRRRSRTGGDVMSPGSEAGGRQSMESPGTSTGDAMAGDGGSRGGGLTDEVRQLMRDRAYERLGNQKRVATDNLGTLAGAVRSMTQQLQDSGQPTLAGYVTRAADSIDRWSSRLREQEIDEAIREVQQFARRRPAMFLGMAFGAGVLAARFFKSTAQGEGGEVDRYDRDLDRGGDRSLDRPWRPAVTSTGGAADRAVAHDTPRVGPDMPSGHEVL